MGAFAGGACDITNQCLDSSATSGPEQIAFSATAGEVYYFIVDGYNGNEGSFSISLSCSP